MPNLFNMAEIVDIGIEKEKKRRDFYGAAARIAADGDVKKLFSRLRDWEEEHVRKFTAIRKEIDERETAESHPGELSEYMQALVSDQLYSDITPEEMARRHATPLAALTRGIDFEKDAIIFFRGLGDFLSSPHRKIVEELIREEQNHLVYLTRLREKYAGG